MQRNLEYPNALAKVGREFSPVIWVGAPSEFLVDAGRWSRSGLAIEVLDGTRMRTDTELFDEFGDRLRFPKGFGRNWDALSDSLIDLNWGGAGSSHYAIGIASGDSMLSGDPSSLTQLVSCLRAASEFHGTPADERKPWNGKPTAFHVVLQIAEPELLRARNEWKEAGAQVTVLER